MTNVRGALGTGYFLCLAILAPLAGCTGGSSDYSEEEIQAKIVEFDYEKGVQGFEPPSLEELEANNTWTDKPVIDLLDKLKKGLANYTPPMPPAEAVNLKSENDEQITEILESVKVMPKSEDEVDWEGTWVHHVAGDINSLNPLTMSSTSDFDVAALTGVGSITSDIDLNAVGNGTFIKTWQVNEDNTVHKFVIRDDLTWSDGEPITAYDWEFTFKLVKHPDMVAYMPAISSGMETVLYLKAYDEHTFCIFHEKSTAVNEWKDEFPVIPKHIYYESIAMDPSMVDSDIHLELENKPVVGGPYEVLSRTRGKNVILQRREGFYMHDGKQVRDKPFFKNIRMEVITDTNTALLALSSGKIDEMEIPAPKWNTDANTPEFFAKNVRVKATEWTEYHITWNCESEFFKDAKVRRAMSYGIDYKELLDRVLDGLFEQANGPFHPSSWMSPKPPLPMFMYDLDKARKLLDEAGWVDSDADGIRDKMINGKKVPFHFTLMRGQTPTSEKVARVVETSLNKLGIKVEERATEFTVLQQKAQDHTFDAMLGGWGSGTDPFYTKNIFGTDQTRNYGQYSNKKIDELYEEGMVELDREKRAKIYQEMAKIFYEDQPYTWLFYLSSLYGFNKDMRGYEFSARGPFHYSPGMESVWKVKPL